MHIIFKTLFHHLRRLSTLLAFAGNNSPSKTTYGATPALLITDKCFPNIADNLQIINFDKILILANRNFNIYSRSFHAYLERFPVSDIDKSKANRKRR